MYCCIHPFLVYTKAYSSFSHKCVWLLAQQLHTRQTKNLVATAQPVGQPRITGAMTQHTCMPMPLALRTSLWLQTSLCSEPTVTTRTTKQ